MTDEAESLRARGVSVIGPAHVVEQFTSGRRVLGRQALGRTAQVTIDGGLSPADRVSATDLGLELGPVDLQDLFVHLTGKETVR